MGWRPRSCAAGARPLRLIPRRTAHVVGATQLVGGQELVLAECRPWSTEAGDLPHQALSVEAAVAIMCELDHRRDRISHSGHQLRSGSRYGVGNLDHQLVRGTPGSMLDEDGGIARMERLPVTVDREQHADAPTHAVNERHCHQIEVRLGHVRMVPAR